mmetsp:Transcript_11012/g.30196  ORF Transcript_11012/g.30196 Transcript_11012/m.30196 type:complete len:325 (-) Transcript_11012:359-1333(-)
MKLLFMPSTSCRMSPSSASNAAVISLHALTSACAEAPSPITGDVAFLELLGLWVAPTDLASSPNTLLSHAPPLADRPASLSQLLLGRLLSCWLAAWAMAWLVLILKASISLRRPSTSRFPCCCTSFICRSISLSTMLPPACLPAPSSSKIFLTLGANASCSKLNARIISPRGTNPSGLLLLFIARICARDSSAAFKRCTRSASICCVCVPSELPPCPVVSPLACKAGLCCRSSSTCRCSATSCSCVGVCALTARSSCCCRSRAVICFWSCWKLGPVTSDLSSCTAAPRFAAAGEGGTLPKPFSSLPTFATRAATCSCNIDTTLS